MTHPEPTPSEVQDIMDTSLDTASLQAHIDASKFDVEDVADLDPTISDDRLTTLHKYLAAHYASSQEKRLSSQSGESRSLSYSSEDSSSYLEAAIRIDPTGLIAQGNKPKASLSTPDLKGVNDP